MTIHAKDRFVSSNIADVILRYSLPMVGAIIALLSYDLLESSLLAQSTTETLTALGFTIPITTAMTAIAVATSIHCHNRVIKSTCLAQNELKQTISSSLTSSFFVIFSIALVGLILGPSLLKLMGNSN